MSKLDKVLRVQRACGVDGATARRYLEAEEWVVWDAIESIRADRHDYA